MNRILSNFAEQVSTQWMTLPKDKILEEIKNSFYKTRGDHRKELKEIPNDFGIYAFFIKPNNAYNMEKLQGAWNIEGFRKYPKIVKKRFLVGKSNDEWFTFYIGKGEKLKSRLNEHLNHHSNHSTYGLKLKDRIDFLNQNQIEVAYWLLPEMPDVEKEIKQFIITNLESALREEMKPWIGKQ